MFVDEAVIEVVSGKGGAGCISFRREAKVPKGGPDGGNGGRGGDVWVVAQSQKNTLVDFRHGHPLRAQKGQPGRGADKTGRSGQDLEVKVPAGTLVFDEQSGTLLADLAAPGERVLVAAGGRGGRGNATFVTSVRRAPRYAQPGEPAVEVTLRLELKLLADVGIIGFPSVGKSTLISCISACRPEIAAYPFTTLIPNLGVVERFPGFPFVVADVPGLIEGAHEGKGLGIQFLKHIERTSLLLHMVDLSRDDPFSDWQAIRRELAAFDASMSAKPEIVAVNKADLEASDGSSSRGDELVERFRDEGIPCISISAATGAGVDRLLEGLARKLRRMSEKRAEDDDG